MTILLFEKDIQIKLLQQYLSLALLYELNLNDSNELEYVKRNNALSSKLLLFFFFFHLIDVLK
jgi:hypothetical protein